MTMQKKGGIAPATAAEDRRQPPRPRRTVSVWRDGDASERTADSPRPQHVGGPSRSGKARRLRARQPAANRDGSRSDTERTADGPRPLCVGKLRRSAKGRYFRARQRPHPSQPLAGICLACRASQRFNAGIPIRRQAESRRDERIVRPSNGSVVPDGTRTRGRLFPALSICLALW